MKQAAPGRGVLSRADTLAASTFQRRDRWTHAALRVSDLGLGLTLFFAPLWMGGRQAPGRLVYAITVGLALVGWLAAQALRRQARWRRSGVEWILAAGGVWLGLQITPLPWSWVEAASPLVAHRLPLWTHSPPLLGRWCTISLTPEETRTCLMVFLVHACLFVAVLQRLNTLRDIHRLLAWTALAAVLLACLGIAQQFLGNGKFLWIYEHPSRLANDAVKGPFANQNHFAHFLALALGPLALTQTRLGRRAAPLGGAGRMPATLHATAWWMGLAVVALAAILSFSRGGWMAAAIALVILGLGFWRLRWWSPRILATLTLVLVGVLGGSLLLGLEPLSQRLATLQEARSLAELSARRDALWKAHLSTLPEVWMVGAGAGSHRYLYPTFMRNPFGVDFSHADNSYLQLLLETGAPGLTLVLLGWGVVLRWTFVALRRGNTEVQAAAVAVLAPAGASLAHSGCDFVWYIPACMSVTVLCAAAACRLSQLAVSGPLVSAGPTSPSAPHTASTHSVLAPAWCWGCALMCGVALFLGIIRQSWGSALAAPYWDQYWISARLHRVDQSAENSLGRQVLADLARQLESSLRLDPYQPRAHSRLVSLKLRLFDEAQMRSDNPLPLSQIREAALASRFSSAMECRQWLQRALGDRLDLLYEARQHARQALRLCPLQGEAYIFLSELLFLEQVDDSGIEPLIQQALQVRPHQGPVLMAAGSQEVFRGNVPQALQLWREAFQLDPAVQQRLIAVLGPQLSAPQLVEQFEPDVDALERIYWHYANTNRADEAQWVGAAYGQALQEQAAARCGAEAAYLWMRASSMYARLGEAEKALNASRSAVHCSPRLFEARRQLARRLTDLQYWQEAIDQWRWCLHRRPNDDVLLQQLRISRAQSLKTLSTTR